MQLTTIFPEIVAIYESEAPVSSGSYQMFASTQPFQSQLTKGRGAFIIHSEYRSRLHTKKIVEGMERRRTAANRTCRPLEVGVPLRLVDAFTGG